jgi:protein-disulfide isomerase
MIPNSIPPALDKEIHMKRRLQPLIAISLLAFTAAPSFAADNTAVTPAERAKIEAVVHDYLLRKPEVMVEVMQVLQRKQFEQTQQTVKQTQQSAGNYIKNLFQQTNDPVSGNPKGKITVVEFFDYQCPHCVDMAPVMKEVIKANPELRVVYKEFPIRGPVSDFAARAALAANKQGKYTELSYGILTSTKPLSNDVILEVAKNTGLNIDQLKKDMDSKEIKEQLKANVILAQNLKLFGTPAFFIGKTDATSSDAVNYIPGQVDQAQLQIMIDKMK